MTSEVAGSSPVRLTHYCIVRQDLPLGVLAAQLVHAAGESAQGLVPGCFAVVLAAKHEFHLETIEAKLIRRGIPHQAVREPDPPWNGALMAIGIQPVWDRTVLKPVTKNLKLLKELKL